MGRMFAYLIRFAVILIGYAAAALAASAFIHLLFLGAAGFQPDESTAYVVGPLLFSIPFTALFVGYFAFVPAGVAIVVSEILGLRNWLFYALAGAAIGVAVVALFWQSPMPGGGFETEIDSTFMTPRFIASMIGSGIVGGIAYWLVSGRWAGNWRSEPQPQLPTSPGPSGS
ncbi:hypothetical protein ASD64_02275 [Mesorhizobium sp. Root157]|uniref:hypothetical protein n=1 Tax=Mesorhizobium sp. Root157 TaxID=1736477 RepID=UPI0006F39D6E|nr:hypothetical protein [Mesorhizobium sp. Root157]KRA00409.1 hypothetical protein ASD64_02275 [Mesorhizobium sp. Root157]